MTWTRYPKAIACRLRAGMRGLLAPPPANPAHGRNGNRPSMSCIPISASQDPCNVHGDQLRAAASVLRGEERGLFVCRPFAPSPVTDRSPFSYFFVDLDCPDVPTIRSVAKNYTALCVESCIADRLALDADPIHHNLTVVDDVVEVSAAQPSPTRVLFLVSNDTHVHLFLRIADCFDHVLFAIVKPSDKDEGAAKRLDEQGIAYIEIGYSDRSNKQVASFRPHIAFCANDWTSEFRALYRILEGTQTPCVALQEGPQDWRMTVKNKDPKKYRNADVFFSQGAVTLKYISPKYFAVTGNPKTDHITEAPLPEKPRVFINCNFTYGQWEDCRKQWMNDIIGTCKQLGLDYLISKHPRDHSTWDDPNLVTSSAFSLRDQLKACSIAVSRFSNIPYEALSLGRSSVYYNPHGETPRSFSEDRTPGLKKAFNRRELEQLLETHKRDPSFDKSAARLSMYEHCGPMDGRSVDRIVNCLNETIRSRVRNHELLRQNNHYRLKPLKDVLFSVVICTHNRSGMLPRVMDSLLEKQRSAICFEVIVVDNASTDNTREVVEPYARRDNVRYVIETKLGLSHARNAGWRNASGRYVAFLDDDGEVSEDWLEGFLDVFTAHPDAAACGGRIFPRYAVPKPAWISGIAERFYGHYDLGDEVSACEWVPGGNAVWRREVLETLGGFDSRFGRKGHGMLVGGEESQLIYEAIQRGYKFYYSPKALMFHHISSDRVTIRYLARRWFGQGFSDFRYREVRNLIGRRAACRESIRMLGKSLYETARMMRHAIMWRRERVLPRLFDLMRYLGWATGAARCAWKGPVE